MHAFEKMQAKGKIDVINHSLDEFIDQGALKAWSRSCSFRKQDLYISGRLQPIKRWYPREFLDDDAGWRHKDGQHIQDHKERSRVDRGVESALGQV